MVRESKRQFHDDGTHRELSTGYHLYSTDFYLQASLVGARNGYLVDKAILDTGKKCALRLAELAPANLVMPNLNDCDGGRLTCLVSRPLDAGPSLTAAQALYPNLSLVDPNTPRRGYALLMAPRTQKQPPGGLGSMRASPPGGTNIAAFFDSGLVSHRNESGDYLLFRATPFGYGDCPHSHDAPLGVVLHLAGQPLFVDNGVGSYTQSVDRRNAFRSAVGKNTILLNKAGPSVPDSWFSWHKRTDGKLLAVERFRDGFRARGKHAGYSQPPKFHVFIQREVTMLDVGIVVIVDRWDADRELQVQSRFTVNPQIEIDMAHGVLCADGMPKVHFLAAAVDDATAPRVFREQVPYSGNYGHEDCAESLAFETAPTRRGGIVTLLSRIGSIEQVATNCFRCAGGPAIQLRIRQGRLELQWTDSPIVLQPFSEHAIPASTAPRA